MIYTDQFGNPCRRIMAPPVGFRSGPTAFIRIQDCRIRQTFSPSMFHLNAFHTRRRVSAGLPLLRDDLLVQEAWSRFGHTSRAAMPR